MILIFQSIHFTLSLKTKYKKQWTIIVSLIHTLQIEVNFTHWQLQTISRTENKEQFKIKVITWKIIHICLPLFLSKIKNKGTSC